MKNIFKITVFALSFVFIFCACKGNTEYVESNTSSVTQSGSTDSDVVSSTPVKIEIKRVPDREDLLKGAKEVGKTVTVAGELTDQKYAADIAELQEKLGKYSKDISVTVYSLDNKKALFYNTSKQIFGACTVKAAYTLYACQQMDKGNGALTDTMTYEKKHYEPGTGDMQYSPYGTVFTYETMFYKSMSISDNVGYLMAVDRFGRNEYNSWVSQLGCPSLKIEPTVWSLRTKSKDLAVLWREIYFYFEENAAHSEFLKQSCTNTKDNYATAALSGVDYSHKQGHNRTGDWLSCSDAGIVWKDGSPYVIAVLTNGAGSGTAEKQVMADIINIVHNKLF